MKTTIALFAGLITLAIAGASEAGRYDTKVEMDCMLERPNKETIMVDVAIHDGNIVISKSGYNDNTIKPWNTAVSDYHGNFFTRPYGYVEDGYNYIFYKGVHEDIPMTDTQRGHALVKGKPTETLVGKKEVGYLSCG